MRALQDIKKGDIIGEYNGTFILLQEEDTNGDTTYLFNLEGPSGSYPEPLTNGAPTCLLAAGERGNWTRFLNHARDPGDVSVRMVQSLYGDAMRVVVEAVKDIAFGEQLLTNYGPGYFGEEDTAGGGTGGPKRTKRGRFTKMLNGVPWQEGGLWDTRAEAERRKRAVGTKSSYPYYRN